MYIQTAMMVKQERLRKLGVNQTHVVSDHRVTASHRSYHMQMQCWVLTLIGCMCTALHAWHCNLNTIFFVVLACKHQQYA